MNTKQARNIKVLLGILVLGVVIGGVTGVGFLFQFAAALLGFCLLRVMVSLAFGRGFKRNVRTLLGR